MFLFGVSRHIFGFFDSRRDEPLRKVGFDIQFCYQRLGADIIQVENGYYAQRYQFIDEGFIGAFDALNAFCEAFNALIVFVGREDIDVPAGETS